MSLLALTLSGMVSGEALYLSEVLKAADETRLVPVKAEVKGKKVIELRVDGVDGISNDWANWIEPVFVLADGKKVAVTREMVKKSEQGWSDLKIDKNTSGGQLVVGGKTFAKGFGTHADSVIQLAVPEGAVAFEAKAGLDDGGAIRDGKTTPASALFVVIEPGGTYELPKPAPEQVALENFAVKGDLEITVWASTPQLYNPTNMDIDRDGRIWVAEGVNYRRHQGRRAEGDRIVVLEDSDGDGKADSSHTFVQEKALVAPLGVAVIDNK
ncbi:MAG: DUF7133 domain-containing protein, partial [Verrucomicrobiales bacterium]